VKKKEDLTRPCGYCGAQPGERCTGPRDNEIPPHKTRLSGIT